MMRGIIDARTRAVVGRWRAALPTAIGLGSLVAFVLLSSPPLPLSAAARVDPRALLRDALAQSASTRGFSVDERVVVVGGQGGHSKLLSFVRFEQRYNLDHPRASTLLSTGRPTGPAGLNVINVGHRGARLNQSGWHCFDTGRVWPPGMFNLGPRSVLLLSPWLPGREARLPFLLRNASFTVATKGHEFRIRASVRERRGRLIATYFVNKASLHIRLISIRQRLGRDVRLDRERLWGYGRATPVHLPKVCQHS